MSEAQTISGTLPRFERTLRLDVLVGALIFAFTAVPFALRLPNEKLLYDALSLELFPMDVVANVVGYVPLGMVLAKRGTLRALLFGGLLSLAAEAIQLFSVGRDPGVVDVATNLAGAGLGLWIAAKGRTLPDEVAITPRDGAMAAAAAIAYVLFGASVTPESLLHRLSGWLEAPPWMTTSPRGAIADGTIEAHLSFEQLDSGVVSGATETRISGTAVNGPSLSAGMVGSAISLNGNQWVDLGNPVSLRLTGSLTLSAWVRPLAFPVDDAAVISSLSDNELGYQLDLTVDEGTRTIGFKLASGLGHLMVRYGKTSLVAGRWYHVAAVYGAGARTMDVYLDGRLDNGCLIGTVTGRQQPSRGHVFVGRRAGSAGYEFIGSIDEVEIQSRQRSQSDIEAEVRAAGRVADRSVQGADGDDRVAADETCMNQARAPRVAGPLVSLGMLIALGCAGLWRGRRFSVVAVALCLLTGSSAVLWRPDGTAFWTTWGPPLCVLSGGFIALVALRMRRSDGSGMTSG